MLDVYQGGAPGSRQTGPRRYLLGIGVGVGVVIGGGMVF